MNSLKIVLFGISGDDYVIAKRSIGFSLGVSGVACRWCPQRREGNGLRDHTK